MKNKKGVEVQCELVKVQNVANGAYRWYLDVPAIYAEQSAWALIKANTTGIILKAVFVVDEDDE